MTPSLLTSWDDGRKEDIRLAGLLRKYNLPAIFYVPVEATELSLAYLRDLAQEFEIGAHTLSHPLLTRISPDEAQGEIEGSKWVLEDALGVAVRSFCYPRGYCSEELKAMVRAAGYQSARGVKVGSLEYRDPYEMQTTVHAYNRDEYDMPWLDYARQMIASWLTIGGVFHLWGHSWEVEKYDDWGQLETLFGLLSEARSI